MTKPKSGRYPWFKFNPRRWLSDIELRSCSPAARGVWADMISIIHEADSGGYLLIGGEQPDAETMARIVGVSVKEYQALEKELERRKVFSRRADGAIYCRKTVREADAAREPQGSPSGHPADTPKGLPKSPDGFPPSRALSHSQLSPSPGGSPEGGSELPPDARPDIRSRCLGMHPTLDTPEVRAALDRWEEHLRERGKAPYTSRNWEANLVKWERWGPARLVRAIDATLCTPACTVFEPTHGDEAKPSVSTAPRVIETPEEVDLRERWNLWESRRAKREKRGVYPYPGHEQAKRDLDERAA